MLNSRITPATAAAPIRIVILVVRDIIGSQLVRLQGYIGEDWWGVTLLALRTKAEGETTFYSIEERSLARL